MPRRLLQHLFAILVVLIVAGCSGSGCGGCAGCGVTPLPSGFPKEARVENAGSARLTQSGLAFLSDNIGTLAQGLLGGMGSGGVVTFEIPKSSGSQFGISYEVCPDGPDPNGNPPKCVAEIDLGNAQLDIKTSGPHNITISGPVPLRIQDLPMDITYFFIPSSLDITLSGNQDCPGGGAATFANINTTIPISVEIDANPAHSRHGYTKLVIGDITIDDQQIEDSLHFCGGFDAGLLNSLKGIIVPQLISPLKDTLSGTVNEQLCQKPNPMVSPTCPEGSAADGGLCKYADGECVSIMLGTDGNINLSSFLASLSPGTKGGLDFLFAAGGEGGNPVNGNLNPVGGGATIGLFGGSLPQPKSSCVKLANMAPPQGIPIPDEIMANTVSSWPAGMEGPHVGIGLNERFFNYALAGMYDSGLLCIGLSLDSLDLGLPLDSKLLGTFLGAKSVIGLGIQDEPQVLALTVRPSSPPTAVFGNGTNIDTDPLIRIGLKELSIDFYVWSLDRFIRFMTYTVDVDVPLNLTVTKDGLVPVLNKLGLTNPKITNAELLSDDPDKIAASLTEVISSQLGSALGGAIPAININDQLAGLGLTLNIPETVDGQGSPGLRKLDKGTDHFLGIFATLGLASMPAPPQNDTAAELVKKEVDPAGLALATARPDNLPKVQISMGSPQDDGSQVIEYQIRIDGGFWRPWTTKRYLNVEEGIFRIQGLHKIEVRSRLAGQPLTMDETPAVVDVRIDGQAPVIRVKEVEEGKAQIEVRDVVSNAEGLFVRYRVDAGSWSAWLRASELSLIDIVPGSDVDVEARDEEGLIGSTSQAIRGKPAATSGGGCGCTLAGDSTDDGKIAGLLGALLIGAVLRLGRRGRKEQKGVASAPKAPRATARQRAGRTLRALTCVAAVTTGGLFAGCNCGEVETTSTDNGTTGTGTSGGGCESCDKLSPGLAGSYTSAVVVGDTLWVAGYIEKSISEKGDNFQWGDLGVGKVDDTGAVEWELVDGVPEQEVDPKEYDVSGFRGGVTDPGDDVGLWTSIAAKDDGTLGVAYYDRTHRSLKFAFRAGTVWTVTTVQEKASSDIGRYAKLVYANGAWNLAFLAVEPGQGGAVSSGVRLATSADGASWTFEDVYVDAATPCAARYCATGSSCIIETGLCMAKVTGCDPSCSSGTACVDVGGPTCKDERTASKIETYPDASGLYISMAPDKGSLGMVFYDRVKGNLMMASKASGSWVTTILDGEANGADTGDVGIGATLAIDGSGVWHVAYSNGYDESLQYLQVKDGVPAPAEVIDDGVGVEGTPFTDGRHIVGDDASIHVTAGGDIHVSYQDATSGKLHHALGTPSANGHSWAVKVIAQEGFGGAFSKIVDHQGTLKVVNWSRSFGGAYVGDVSVVKP